MFRMRQNAIFFFRISNYANAFQNFIKNVHKQLISSSIPMPGAVPPGICFLEYEPQECGYSLSHCLTHWLHLQSNYCALLNCTYFFSLALQILCKNSIFSVAYNLFTHSNKPNYSAINCDIWCKLFPIPMPSLSSSAEKSTTAIIKIASTGKTLLLRG